MEYTLTVRRLAWILSACITVLTVINIAVLVAIYGLDMQGDWLAMLEFRFRVDYEKNFPALYSSLSLLLCAVFLCLISLFTGQAKQPYRFHWAFLSLVFVFLSIDEFFMLHEKTNEPMRALMQENASGVFLYAWVVPYFLGFLALVILYLRFFFRLPRLFQIWFVISAVIYVGGAIGVEMISAYIHDSGKLTAEGELMHLKNMTYVTIESIEEFMEMAGSAIFACTLLHYIKSTFGAKTLSLHLK